MSQLSTRIGFQFVCVMALVLSILTACTSGPTTPVSSKGEKSFALPTPSPTVATYPAKPACPQPVCYTASTVPGIRLIDSWDSIHTFQTFSYDTSYSQALNQAKSYDFVWGAKLTNAEAFRIGNPDTLLSYYIPLNRDGGSFTDAQLGRTRGLSYWKATHPDWVQYRCDGTTPALQLHDPNIPLDMSNPAFIDWQIQTYIIPASQSGYNAIAIDNLNLDNGSGACGTYKNGTWVPRYTSNPDDTQYRADLISYVTTMQAKLHALPHPMALIANVGFLNGDAITDTVYGDSLTQVVNHLDGLLDEAGYTQYGKGFLTDEGWLGTEQLILAVQKAHKPYYSLNELEHMNPDTKQWVLASYLMSKEHSSYIFISPPQSYGTDRRLPEYNADIGLAISEMYQDQGVYWRKFSNGLAVVNPSSTTPTSVTLPTGSYKDIYGKAVNSPLTLNVHSGLVLLKK